MSVSRAEVERAALELTAEERLEIATALFESVERESAQPELPEWQRRLLDEGSPRTRWGPIPASRGRP